jgi:hypothetical protein
MAARVRADEHDLIQERLPPAQAALFYRMARSDRRHCLDVYYTLIRAGYREEDLLRAALLHDVGKAAGDRGGGMPMTVLHRVAIVLLQAFTVRTPGTRTKGTQGIGPRALGPRWLARLAADGRGWKAPFAVHARHARAGAEWAAEAGCSPAVVALIRAHHGEPGGSNPPRLDPDDGQLAALIWADECN